MSFLDFYQHLPSHTTPYLFTSKHFSLRWYSIGYIMAFITAYLVVYYRIKKESQFKNISLDKIENFFLMAVVGVVLGGRIAYVFIYGYDQFKGDLFHAFFPFYRDSTNWLGFRVTGYAGMSYHGGLIGVLLTFYIFSRIYKISILKIMNLLAPGIALGYVWGRLGNFMNGELYGRITTSSFGMYFYNHMFGFEQKYLRHPSQLYEAFFEGLVTFLILWSIRKHKVLKDYMLCVYLTCYGVFRFFIEFVRQPDSQFKDKNDSLGTVLGFMTMGQVLCLIMIILAIVIAFWTNNKKKKGEFID